MATKRRFSFENCGGDESPMRAHGSKRRCCGRHDQGYTLHEFMEKLDPTDLQLVQQLCQKYLVNVPHLSSRTRKYRLQFRNKLEDILFTQKKFKMEVEIVLKDALNKVISSGPMASAKIEIVILDGDFHGDENGEWTEEEFENHVIGPRKDKGSLLMGNLSIELCNGIGCISDARITDNSSWTKSKNFRLGVKLYGGIGMAGEVQEGISNAFRVKDRHGERNQKDRPPLMNDEVCCLKGILKNGPFHKKLLEKGIKTVYDFLSYCGNNPERLRTMIGMPKGIWEKTQDHAAKASSDMKVNGPINLPAPDQNSFEITGSSSTHISNVQFLPHEMSTSALSLPAPKLGVESRNSSVFINTWGAWRGTEQLDIPLDVLMEGNGRSYVSNKFDIGSLWLLQKRLKILFVAMLKVAARSRQRKHSKHSDTSSYGSEPPWEDFHPIVVLTP